MQFTGYVEHDLQGSITIIFNFVRRFHQLVTRLQGKILFHEIHQQYLCHLYIYILSGGFFCDSGILMLKLCFITICLYDYQSNPEITVFYLKICYLMVLIGDLTVANAVYWLCGARSARL
jgi:hypothetical protein